MRFSGKLHTWNEDRGFGFIRPEGGGQDVFVHVSDLPTPRPQPHEVLTSAVALNPRGKKLCTTSSANTAAGRRNGRRARLAA